MRQARTLLLTLLAAATAPAASHAAQFKTLAQFTGQADGGAPFATLKPLHGQLYGETDTGGANGAGTIFAADPSTGAITPLASFTTRPMGETPSPALAESRGKLYGTNYFGGQTGLGCVFAFDPATHALTTLYGFGGENDGIGPQTNVIAHAGTLYGTTADGGAARSRSGAVFAIDPATGTETILHSFGSGKHDGTAPNGLLWHAGTLYGTTEQGGRANSGTVFRIDPTTGHEKILTHFGGGNDGRAPESSLLYVSGVFYGTTASGGTKGDGTLFSVDPKTGTETLLYGFTGGQDGAYPLGGLVTLKGKLYGTAASGGTGSCSLLEGQGCGTVFAFDPGTGKLQILYAFSGGADGGTPYAGLAVQGHRLFGTTLLRGSGGCSEQGCGTLFSVLP